MKRAIRLDGDGCDIDGECCPDVTMRVCWACRGHIAIRLRTLGGNLGQAGMLCESFWMGWMARSGRAPSGIRSAHGVWIPGCNAECAPP